MKNNFIIAVMKKISLLLSVCFFLISVNLAQSSNNSVSVKNQTSTKLQQKLESRREALTKIQETVQNRIQQKTASREGRLTQLKQGIVRKYYEKMSDRMWAVISRLETLSERIEARIEIVDSETDEDLSDIVLQVNNAKALLNDTKILLTSSDDMFETVIASDDPKESFEILRDNINDIKMNLVEVHRFLVKVIGDIYGLKSVRFQVPTPVVTTTAT